MKTILLIVALVGASACAQSPTEPSATVGTLTVLTTAPAFVTVTSSAGAVGQLALDRRVTFADLPLGPLEVRASNAVAIATKYLTLTGDLTITIDIAAP